jgi:hypothetical protein
MSNNRTRNKANNKQKKQQEQKKKKQESGISFEDVATINPTSEAKGDKDMGTSKVKIVEPTKAQLKDIDEEVQIKMEIEELHNQMFETTSNAETTQFIMDALEGDDGDEEDIQLRKLFAENIINTFDNYLDSQIKKVTINTAVDIDVIIDDISDLIVEKCKKVPELKDLVRTKKMREAVKKSFVDMLHADEFAQDIEKIFDTIMNIRMELESKEATNDEVFLVTEMSSEKIAEAKGTVKVDTKVPPKEKLPLVLIPFSRNREYNTIKDIQEEKHKGLRLSC